MVSTLNRRTIWPIAWGILILVLCMMPTSDLPKQGWMNFPYFDKLVHIGLYFVFFWLLHLSTPDKVLTNVLICIGYGILIEILQEFLTTYRSAEVLDVVADTVGATFAAASALIVNRRRTA